MITHLIVENYQSIGHAEFDFGQVNVIVGPRDHGKSALMRALNALFTNQTGSDFIRKGKAFCKVTIGLDTKEVIVWEKTEKSARYIVCDAAGDTREYDKLGGNVPEDVLKLLKIRPIPVEKDFSIMPQIHEQFDQPLLIRESAGRVARALARTTKMDGIVSAQGAAAKNLRAEKSTVKSSKEQIEQLEDRIKEAPDVEALQKGYDHTTEVLNGIADDTETLGLARVANIALQTAKRRGNALLPAEGILRELDADIAALEKVKACWLQYNRALKTLDLTAEEATVAKHECVDLTQAIDDVLAHLEVCPVCGQEMPHD